MFFRIKPVVVLKRKQWRISIMLNPLKSWLMKLRWKTQF